MFQKTFFITILCLAFNFANAQILSVSNEYDEVTTSLFASKLMLVIEEDAMEWSFFADSEQRQIYIDFETLDAAVQSVTIMDGDKALFSDDVSSLPQNTFYELDMRKLKPGFYFIALQTASGVIEKEVILE